LAGVGHTQGHEGVTAIVHVTADAVHLLAAGAWLGGPPAAGHGRRIQPGEATVTSFSEVKLIFAVEALPVTRSASRAICKEPQAIKFPSAGNLS
jgi:putative copper export protein